MMKDSSNSFVIVVDCTINIVVWHFDAIMVNFSAVVVVVVVVIEPYKIDKDNLDP